MFCNIRSLLFAAACLSVSATQAAESTDTHPAAKVVKDYNQSIIAESWEKAAELVEPASMASLRDDYAERAKRPGILTLDDEKMLLSKFAVKDLDGIKTVDPKKFYITYHNIMKLQKPMPEELVKRVKDTMKLNIVGVVEEKELNKAHVLVRSSHENGKAAVENLELISLVKIGGNWLVGLNEQTPRITPLKGAAGPAGAAKKPATK